MLAAAPPSEQKQMLGERLFPLIEQMHSTMAGKITGMLLEIDNSELLHMLEHSEALMTKVDEAVAVLQVRYLAYEYWLSTIILNYFLLLLQAHQAKTAVKQGD